MRGDAQRRSIRALRDQVERSQVERLGRPRRSKPAVGPNAFLQDVRLSAEIYGRSRHAAARRAVRQTSPLWPSVSVLLQSARGQEPPVRLITCYPAEVFAHCRATPLTLEMSGRAANDWLCGPTGTRSASDRIDRRVVHDGNATAWSLDRCVDARCNHVPRFIAAVYFRHCSPSAAHEIGSQNATSPLGG